MSSSAYIIQPTEKSFCPKCHTQVHLLCHKSGDFSTFPAFYLCPSCGHIAQNGVGPVTGRLPVFNSNLEQQVNELCPLFLHDQIPLDITLVSTGEVLYPAGRKITKTILRKIVRNQHDIELDESPYRKMLFKALKISKE
jgi:predicted RNA-binding Zn-ribbon protein involved in translation (DUF1610 family)